MRRVYHISIKGKLACMDDFEKEFRNACGKTVYHIDISFVDRCSLLGHEKWCGKCLKETKWK